jgi:methionyl aminopeptidase
MRLRKEPEIQVKSPEQIGRMYAAGQVVARTLTVLKESVAPGITTAELDSIAEREIRAAGAVPSFLGYFGYPASICTSVNEQVVHGIPSKNQVLRAGDVISIDCGAILDGWHGDSALSVGVGSIDPADQAMLDACAASMWAGIAQAVDGRRLGDISHAVEQSVLQSGLRADSRVHRTRDRDRDAHGAGCPELRAAGARGTAAFGDGAGD